jgi:putative FmdB family regulatory protein
MKGGIGTVRNVDKQRVADIMTPIPGAGGEGTMPMFDYQCKKCGRTDEYIVKSAQTRGLKCKHCGGKTLTKLLAAPNMNVANPNRKEPTYSFKRNPMYD